MPPLDDFPPPHLDPVTRVSPVMRGQRTGPVQLPPGVVVPVGPRLRSAWQRRKQARPGSGTEEAPAAVEVDPPETYGEHGELHPAHGGLDPEGPRVDCEA